MKIVPALMYKLNLIDYNAHGPNHCNKGFKRIAKLKELRGFNAFDAETEIKISIIDSVIKYGLNSNINGFGDYIGELLA